MSTISTNSELKYNYFTFKRNGKTMGINMPGISSVGEIFHNLSYEELYEHELKNKEVVNTNFDTLMVDTGKFTGRSPKDKYVVRQSPSREFVWWGEVNQPINPEIFDDLFQKATNYLNGKSLYVTDGYCGADEETRLSVRIFSEFAWQSHFCKNMFLRPDESDLDDFKPDFEIVNASLLENVDWKKQGLNSETFIVFNLEKKIAVIGGTTYGGEMKKGIFSVMNYLLPLKGILTMHCSANQGKDGDTALFFGLSGTGKTTLSADPRRALIGDDEHGWNDNGVFNLEGGCYAKTAHLKRENEPEIYDAIKRNALLENIARDENGVLDFTDLTKTPNSRVSYPIYHMSNIVEPVSKGGHPSCVIFLTCDAFGVLPPVAKLNTRQAMYHFISGYTAKVAGTERGINEPLATFSPCFGGPFLTLHPHKYAKLLGEKIERYNANVYLVNTGWSGGAYGTGERMSIKVTRSIIDAILDKSIESASFAKDPIFGFDIPEAIDGIEGGILQPKNTWTDKVLYEETAKKLGEMFKKNYAEYAKQDPDMDFTDAGPV